MASEFLPKDHPLFTQGVSLVGVKKSPTSTTPTTKSGEKEQSLAPKE